MKRVLVTLLLTALAVGAWSVSAKPVHADAKPLAVVSFSGYDQWKGDIAYVGRLSDNPDLAVGLEVLLKFMARRLAMNQNDRKANRYITPYQCISSGPMEIATGSKLINKCLACTGLFPSHVE